MKKTGVITHYYKTINYGGSLQAYALCETLLKCGYKSEQICYKKEQEKVNIFVKVFSKGVKRFLKKIFHYCKRIIEIPFEYIENKKLDLFTRRQKAFSNFNDKLIPHSERVYNKDNIKECINDYDVFITGSDQVWNFNWYQSAYFLDFVPSDKIKISYSASLGKASLTKEQKQIFRDSLKDYKAVSLREYDGLELIKGLSPVEPCVTLDPTLLLEKEDWDKVCADRLIQEEYIFCYFLGENKKARKLAKKMAEHKGVKLVALPHTAGIKFIDRKFGAERLYDVSPEQFLALIKYAKFVFTDSFHAVVFSNIYQKDYFVFNRNKQGEMSSRITNITKLFQQEERFCVGKERENFEYIQSLDNIDYAKENKEFEKLKESSIKFLKENLG